MELPVNMHSTSTAELKNEEITKIHLTKEESFWDPSPEEYYKRHL